MVSDFDFDFFLNFKLVNLGKLDNPKEEVGTMDSFHGNETTDEFGEVG